MKHLFPITLIFYCSISHAQFDEIVTSQESYGREKIAALTVGVLQGGGSLIGADLEILAGDRLGLQLGGGLVGLGAAVNLHLDDGYQSSFISLTYWNQGFRETYVQSLIGPTYVYRGKKWFTAQIGLGFQTRESAREEVADLNLPSVQLLYSLGAYFTLD